MTCSHDYRVTGHRIVRVKRGTASTLPQWEIYQAGECAKCKVAGFKPLTKIRAHDAREAGVIARIPEADLPPPEAELQDARGDGAGRRMALPPFRSPGALTT
jgi:hypothetical protein